MSSVDIKFTETDMFYMMLGRTLITTIAAVRPAGHASPRGTAYYIHPMGEGMNAVAVAMIKDFVNWVAESESQSCVGDQSARDALEWMAQYALSQNSAIFDAAHPALRWPESD